MTGNPGAVIEGTLHSADGMGVVRMKARYDTGIDDLWSALTDPQRLVRWYGRVEGDLRVGGEFSAFVTASGWEGRGRIDVCVRPRKLEVTMWEKEGAEGVVAAELVAAGNETILVIERRGIPLDLVWAYGAGWHVHVEDLAAHLARKQSANSDTRWGELEASYREMTVVPLER